MVRRRSSFVGPGPLDDDEKSPPREMLGRGKTHLTARSCRGGHSDEGAERLLDRLALADGRVDKVVQVGVRVDREEVGDFLRAL